MLGMVRDNKKTYYFRLRVPKDVAPYFPCRELKKSLKTPRYRHARTIVLNLMAESEKVFTMIRSNAQTEAMVYKLAKEFLEDGYISLKRKWPVEIDDETYKVLTDTLSPSLDNAIAKIRKLVARGNGTNVIKSEVDNILDDKGIEYDTESPEYK